MVVLKMMQDDLGRGGLGAVRSLGRLGVPVSFPHESRRAPAGFSCYAREHVTWEINDVPLEAAIGDPLALGQRMAHGRRAKKVLQRLGAHPRAR